MSTPDCIAYALAKASHSATMAQVVHKTTPTRDTAHDLFDVLVDPLKRLNLFEYVSVFGSGSGHSRLESGEHEHEKLSKLGNSLFGVFDSSTRAFERLRGMKVHVKELCAAWVDYITNDFRVSHVEWFRETTGSHHEYLIANIVHDGPSTSDKKDLWLRLERRPKTGPHIDRAWREGFTRLFGYFEADDTVTISYQKEYLLQRDAMKNEFRASVSFKKSVSLSYMLGILKIVHEESSSYHIVGAHCWFFASSVVELLDREGHGVWGTRGSDWQGAHWKSKYWLNWGEFKAILARVEMLGSS